jgi:hypothetical protein
MLPLSDNQLHYFASYAVAFVAFGLIGRWYLWPALKDRVPDAGPCVGTTAQGFCDTDRLWRPEGGSARSHCLKARSVGENSSHLVCANISTFKDHVDPTCLGVSYYLAAINVPAMLVVHVLIFAYLLRHSCDLPMSTNKIKENRLGYEPRRP